MNTTEYIGLGLAMCQLSFRVDIDRVPHAYGLRVRHYITLKPNTTDEQKRCIEIWASSHGVSIMETNRIQAVDRLQKWFSVIDQFDFLLNKKDLKNYKMLKWVVENPIPKLPRNKIRNWKRFLSWVAKHDDYEEELRNSINTNNEDRGERNAELERDIEAEEDYGHSW